MLINLVAKKKDITLSGNLLSLAFYGLSLSLTMQIYGCLWWHHNSLGSANFKLKRARPL